MLNDPAVEIASLTREIMHKCKGYTWNEATRLALFVYRREHPGFDDEVLA
jgi:hypothetical protein